MGFSDRRYDMDGDQGGTRMRVGGLMMPHWPSCTAWLIIANVVVFFADGFLGRIQHGPGGHTGFLTEWGHFSFTEAIAHGQVWRFLSYQFLHFDGWHLFGNMLTLFFFGSLVEGYWGTKRFIGYYLLCGAAGAVLYLVLFGLAQAVGPTAADRMPFLLVTAANDPMVGASAAIFGVLIGAYRVAPTMTVLLFFVIPVPLRLLILLILLAEVYAVMVGGWNSGGSAAHLGGVMLGLVLMSRPEWLNWCLRIDAARFSPTRLRADARRRSVERSKRASESLDREVDRVLDKVHREGIHSLTAKEKRTLQEATERERR